ncbi:hypothetical protein ACPRNU_00735 [Chromobacterium vaccinii]|uniref:hypothetical protein n=1 Tax=Chromobacterium vaccinii TaxID=1108595 RepID=UPI003C73EBA8
MSFTLSDLKYTVKRAEKVEEKLGEPLALLNYSSLEHVSELRNAGMQIAMHPNGTILAKATWDQNIHALSPHASEGLRTKWTLAIPSGDQKLQRLCVGSNGDILVNSLYTIEHANIFLGFGCRINLVREDHDKPSSVAMHWHHDVSNRISNGTVVSQNMSWPTITNDSIYFSNVQFTDGGGQGTYFHRLSLTDGKVLWERTRAERGFDKIAQLRFGEDHALYVPLCEDQGGAGEILKVSPSDGLIETVVKGSGCCCIGLNAGGSMYGLTGTYDEGMGVWSHLALSSFVPDNKTYVKKVLFTFPEDFTTTEYHPSLILGPKKTVYLALNRIKSNVGEAQIYAIREDGSLLWMQHVDGTVSGSPVLTEEGTLYFSVVKTPSSAEKARFVHKGEIEARNAATGAPIWSTTIEGIAHDFGNINPFLTSPILAQDGTVYVGIVLARDDKSKSEGMTFNSCALALRAHQQLASADAAWPIAHGTAGHSGISPLWPL